MQIRAGTSGWMYDHWRGRFYPQKLPRTRWFEYYLQVFDTVELNGTFYGTPQPETVQRWHDMTPPGFLFAVKGTRFLTHNKKLHDPEQSLQRHNEMLRPLKEKLGPILWQFSVKWELDPERLRHFLGLRPPGQRWCFEFRHASLFCGEVYEMLREHNCALVWADAEGYPFAPEVTADFLYARLHGHESLYASKYPRKQLGWWRDQLLENAAGKRDIFAYFDNDAHGNAPHDAWRLRELLRGAKRVPDEIPDAAEEQDLSRVPQLALSHEER